MIIHARKIYLLLFCPCVYIRFALLLRGEVCTSDVLVRDLSSVLVLTGKPEFTFTSWSRM